MTGAALPAGLSMWRRFREWWIVRAKTARLRVKKNQNSLLRDRIIRGVTLLRDLNITLVSRHPATGGAPRNEQARARPDGGDQAAVALQVWRRGWLPLLERNRGVSTDFRVRRALRRALRCALSCERSIRATNTRVVRLQVAFTTRAANTQAVPTIGSATIRAASTRAISASRAGASTKAICTRATTTKAISTRATVGWRSLHARHRRICVCRGGSFGSRGGGGGEGRK